jgi:hypothetical protein
MLGRLQLGRVRWQEQEVDVVGYAQLGTGVPPRAVEHEDDLLVGPAPTARANASSSTANSSILTVVAKWKTVRPEAGWTNPTR